MALDEPDAEEVLLQLDECFVYKVPPRTSSTGYRAEAWGLDSPFATCIARVVVNGDVISVKLLQPRKAGEATDKLFAAANMPTSEVLEHGLDHFVEPVSGVNRFEGPVGFPILIAICCAGHGFVTLFRASDCQQHEWPCGVPWHRVSVRVFPFLASCTFSVSIVSLSRA